MQITKDIIQWIKYEVGETPKVVIGISGGKDSTIVAKLCVEALGKDRVIGVRLPQGNQHDLNVAKEVCEYLGIKSYEFNIKDTVDMIDKTLAQDFGENVKTNSVHYSNTPARVRMTYLYAVAALIGNCRVANTCNKSENYIGYSTKYGDHAGDFSPLAELCVREVLEIGKDLGLPDKFVFKAPEDGLSGKTDEDNLGFTYEELDSMLLDKIYPEEKKLCLIEDLYIKNLHKSLPMPVFKPKKQYKER